MKRQPGSSLCAAAQTARLLTCKLEISRQCVLSKESESMLWTIMVVLLVLWLVGFFGHIGGGLIHILLVAAVIVLIYNLVVGRRTI